MDELHKIQAAQVTKDEFNSKCASLSQKIDSCSNKLEEFSNIIAEHNFQITQLNNEMAVLKRENRELKEKVANLETHGYTIDVNELSNRINRSSNVILFNVNESVDEQAVIKEIINITAPNFNNSFEFMRLGNKPTTAGKARPLKIRFCDTDTARTVLKNKSSLSGTRFSSVRIQDDKTPTQLNDLKRVRQTLRQRLESGEQNLTIKYLKGTPTIISTMPKND